MRETLEITQLPLQPWARALSQQRRIGAFGSQTVSQLPAPTNVRWDVAPFVKWDNVAGATAPGAALQERC